MDTVIGAITRRGVETHRHVVKTEINVPTWGIVLMVGTALFFLGLLTMVDYTFNQVIPTLVMVESPQAILFEPISSEDPDAPLTEDKKVETESELMIVKQKPITSSFRSTIQHLRSRAGFFSRFRGLFSYAVYTFAVTNVTSALAVVTIIPTLVAPIIACVLCAPLSMVWTHIVISDPSPKRWYQRVQSFKSWKKIAGPTAVLAIAEQLSIILPTALSFAYGLNMSSEAAKKLSCSEHQLLVFKGLSVAVLTIALRCFLVIPASVSLTRVQASLLADDEETIVPFDRSFGGKVIPEIVGGTGVVGVRDAWKTFDWNSRVRLAKTYVKTIAMETAIVIMMVSALVGQLVLILGDDFHKLIPKGGHRNEITILPTQI